VNEVTRKAAELDPETALKFIEENNFQSMPLSSVLPAYVEGVIKHSGEAVDWLGIADDLKSLSPSEGILWKPNQMPGRRMLVSEWAKVDPGAALEWYVSDAEIELNQPEGAVVVGRILGGIPPENQPQAVRWMEQVRDQGGWDDQLVASYGKTLAIRATSLGPDVERVVKWMADENGRYEFVVGLIQPPARLPIQDLENPIFQFDRSELINLVHAADLPAEKRSDLLQRIESRNSSR